MAAGGPRRPNASAPLAGSQRRVPGNVSKVPAAAAGGAGRGAAGYTATGHSHITSLRVAVAEEKSPRLLPFDDGMAVGAPLLPQPEEHGPEERFCMDGPVIQIPGMPARRPATQGDGVLPFPTLVTRMESSVSQASLLLNDRLRTLHGRVQKATLSDLQISELCEIADGVCAAAYHVRKWAAALAPSDEGMQKPAKPGNCEDKDEALAVMHLATSHIIVASACVCKCLRKAITDHCDKAEATVNRIGVPTHDVRALAPHLEAVLCRLSRLSAKVVPTPTARARPEEKLTMNVQCVLEFAEEAKQLNLSDP